MELRSSKVHSHFASPHCLNFCLHPLFEVVILVSVRNKTYIYLPKTLLKLQTGLFVLFPLVWWTKLYFLLEHRTLLPPRGAPLDRRLAVCSPPCGHDIRLAADVSLVARWTCVPERENFSLPFPDTPISFSLCCPGVFQAPSPRACLHISPSWLMLTSCDHLLHWSCPCSAVTAAPVPASPSWVSVCDLRTVSKLWDLHAVMMSVWRLADGNRAMKPDMF